MELPDDVLRWVGLPDKVKQFVLGTVACPTCGRDVEMTSDDGSPKSGSQLCCGNLLVIVRISKDDPWPSRTLTETDLQKMSGLDVVEDDGDE